MKKLLFLLFPLFVFSQGTIYLTDDDIKAVYGGVGYGQNTVGGRGGDLYIVDDYGTGSSGTYDPVTRIGRGTFRYCLVNTNTRMIGFDIGGYLDINSGGNLLTDVNEGNFTILGQTAPAGGVALTNNSLWIQGSEVIVGYFTVRTTSDGPANVDALAIQAASGQSISQHYIHHSTFTHGVDENISYSGTSTSVSMQNATFDRVLLGKQDTGDSFRRNMLAGRNVDFLTMSNSYFTQTSGRNPLWSYNNMNAELINNIVYGGSQGPEMARDTYVDIIGNLCKPLGSSGWSRAVFSVSEQGFGNPLGSGDYYWADNIVTDLNGQDFYNAEMLAQYSNTARVAANSTFADNSWITGQANIEAHVLNDVGNSYANDALDQDWIADYYADTGTYTVESIPSMPNTSHPVGYDTDGDLMSDTWEALQGSDIEHFERRATFVLSDGTILDQSGVTNYATTGYTAIEVFAMDKVGAFDNAPVTNTIVLTNDDLRAFPGAEGFGKDAGVGMNRRVVFMDNTNNSGTGSLRAAIDDAESNNDFTIIIPRLGGTVTLGNDPIFSGNSSGSDSNFYFAGHLAPGDGVTIRADDIDYGGALTIRGSDAILRYIRIHGGSAMPSGTDCLTIRHNTSVTPYTLERVIVDHVSLYWGQDEILEVGSYDAGIVQDITISNTIIAEPFGTGYGTLFFATESFLDRLTYYGILHVDVEDRPPYMSSCNQSFEVINTMSLNNKHIFNLSINTMDYIGNVGKWHPSYQPVNGGTAMYNLQTNTFEVAANRSYCPSAHGCCDNFNEGDRPVFVSDFLSVGDNTTSSLFDTDLTTFNASSRVITDSFITPFPSSEVEGEFIDHVGASAHRDAHDTRVTQEFIDNDRNYEPATENDVNVGGHLTYNSGSSYPDSDNDGLSDAYETANGGNVDINGRPAIFNLPDGRIINQAAIDNFATVGFTHIDVFLADQPSRPDGSDDWDLFQTVNIPDVPVITLGKNSNQRLINARRH